MKGGTVMAKVALYKQDGSKTGDIQLQAAVFGIEPNEHVLREAVFMQQSSKRQGTHAVKSRSEVRGGGRKPWRQKGTGRARQGSIRAPHWVGGGAVCGPTPRSSSYTLPRQRRRVALRSALSTKVNEDILLVLDSLSFDAPESKEVVNMLKLLDLDEIAPIIPAEKDENVIRSANNLRAVKV